VAVLAALPGPAAPAFADDVLTVSVASVEGGTVHLLASVPATSAKDLPAVAVRFGDTPLTASVEQVQGSTQKAVAVARAVVVVIDTSGSMEGARIQAARDAALDFVGTVPADLEIGLIAFSDTPRVLVNPTPDRAAVRNAIGTLQAAGETALYDGLSQAADLLKGYPEKRLLLLTDGADTVSKTTLDGVISTLAGAKIPVDVVALQVAPTDLARMRQLTAAAGGTVYQAANTAALATAFKTAADSYQLRLAIAVSVPPGLAGKSGELVVTMTSGLSRSSATVAVTFAELAPNSGATFTAVGPGFSVSPLVVAAGVFVVLLALSLLVLAPLVGRDRRKRLTQVAKFGLSARATKRTGVVVAAPAEPAHEGGITQVVLGLSDRMMQSRGAESRVAVKLERAGISLSPAEWTAIRSGTTIGGALLGFLGMGWIGIVVGAIAGWLLAGVYRNVRTSRRTRAFSDQLPDALQMIIGSLRSGFSLQQSVDAVTKDATPGPVTLEFGRAVAETRIGSDIPDALERVAQRTRNSDLRWAVMAMRIQRETGGNLAEVLEATVETIRERDRLRRQVRALSAEGRLSAYILVGLPILLGLWMFFLRRDYMRPLWTTTIGLAMLGTAVALVVVGAFWMSRWVKVEV